MNDDLDKITTRLAREAKIGKKQELALEKEIEREQRRQAAIEPQFEATQPGKSIYSVVVVAKFEYNEGQSPDEKKLAEDVARTLIKWAEQKSIISIDPKEPVPELVSLDVDVQ